MSITDILTASPEEMVNKGNVAGNSVLPIEVKAGKRGAMQSMFQLLKKRPQMRFGMRCALENFSSFENIKVYPLYAISNLRSI